MEDLKYILVTGSDGNLGGKTTKLLADSTEYGVIAVSSFPDRIPLMVERERIVHTEKVVQMSSDEMFAADLSRFRIAGAVHYAFSRAIFPKQDIASSLDYSLAAFKKLVDAGVQNAIYISSQSVYGDSPDWRVVGNPPAPASVYAMAKYAGEKLFDACYMGHEELQHAILRLDYIIQSQNLVKALCKSAKESGVLRLKGGKQVFSYLDAGDVPKAVLSLLESRVPWQGIYNVGPDRMRYSLEEVAGFVKAAAAKRGISVEIELERNDTELWGGMDSSAFMRDTGWRPSCDVQTMIDRIFEEA